MNLDTKIAFGDCGITYQHSASVHLNLLDQGTWTFYWDQEKKKTKDKDKVTFVAFFFKRKCVALEVGRSKNRELGTDSVGIVPDKSYKTRPLG